MNVLSSVNAFLFSACFLTIALPANATFLGDTVTVTYQWPMIGSVLYSGGSAVSTSAGTTFELSSGGIPVTVTDSAITVTFPDGWFFSNSTRSFDGIVVTDLSAHIAGASLDSTNIAGYVGSDVTFDATDVFINFPYPPFASLPSGATLTVDVTSTAAPEPATGALLLLSAFGLAVLYQISRFLSLSSHSMNCKRFS